MITIDNQKQCSKCKEWKPATNEFFGNQKTGALGLISGCKDCERVRYELNREQVKKRSSKWREANPERAKEYGRKWREANPERCKKNSRKWYEANPERHKETCRKWREANPERCKKNSRKWQESNSERCKESSRKWYEANTEQANEACRKWREANPERANEFIEKWREANPEKMSAQRQQRRALKANADGTSTAEQIKARFQYHENRCYYCGDNESGLHVEHRIPLSRGGSNWPSNLVPACPMCNLSKGTKTEKEFVQCR